MINLKYKDAFIFFLHSVRAKNINWALTGSYRLYLENTRLVPLPNDIDILTDYEGLKLIKSIFRHFIHRTFSYSEATKIKSHFGQLQIKGIVFDIMSEVQNKVNGGWENIPNLDKVDFLLFENYSVPVLPLPIEFVVSKNLNQKSKTSTINKIMKA